MNNLGNIGCSEFQIAAHANEWLVRELAAEDFRALGQLCLDGLSREYVEADQKALDRVEGCDAEPKQVRYWVAAAGDRILGAVTMVAICRDVARLRWAQVVSASKGEHRILRRLVRAAVTYASELGFLKLVLHAPTGSESVLAALLHQMGFEFSRNTTSAGQNVLEFYLNLYHKPDSWLAASTDEEPEDHSQATA